MKALAIHKALAAVEPANSNYRYAAGVDYEYLGIAFNKLGDLTGDPENYRAALENHRAELKINETLAASDPANGAYRRILADVYGEVGLSQLKLQRTAEALENFRHQLAIFESLRISDPTNVEAQRYLASSYGAIGEVLAQSGDLSAALVTERKAVAIDQELSAAEPADTEVRINLLSGFEAVGKILAKTGDVEGALDNYQKALALLEAWSRSEPESVPIHRLLAIEETNIAETYKQMAVRPKSPTDESRAHWRKAQMCYQRSLNAWQRVRDHGRLNKTDEMKMVELTNELAKCSGALAQQ